jgi:flagellar biosynthesis protein FlhF
MDYFVEQAPNDYEVQALIRKKYGDRARILARKEIRTGGVLGLFQRRAIEVTGYCTHAPQSRTPLSRGNMMEEKKRILAAAGGDQEKAESKSAPEGQSSDGKGSADMNALLKEIRFIKDHLNRPGDTSPAGPAASEPEALGRIRDILEENDFSRSFIDATVKTLRQECSFDELSDFDHVAALVVEGISKSVDIYPWQERRRSPHVFVLVGPTGVGKTTTIAKLAAMYGAVADPSYDVRILTIDSYRIGALQQIEKYGEIMNIPVHAVETVDDMEKQLAIHRDADFIFVDTIGKSPNDFARLAEVNRLVRSAGGEVHLAVSATTKRSDIEDILRHFEPFNYQAVVITKMDETSTVGGVISALKEKQKSVSFVTDGQSVPQDIERARKHTFLRRLRDLPVERREPETVLKE